MPNIVDIATGKTLYANFSLRATTASDTYNAYSYFSDWQAELGLTGGTISGASGDNTTIDTLDLLFNPTPDATTTQVKLGYNSGLMVSLNSWSTGTTNLSTTIGGTSFSSIYVPNPRPSAQFVVRNPADNDQKVYSLFWQRSTATNEVIMMYETSNPATSGRLIRVAIRLKRGIIKMAIQNISAGTSAGFFVAQFDQSTGTAGAGSALQTSLSETLTYYWESDPPSDTLIDGVGFRGALNIGSMASISQSLRALDGAVRSIRKPITMTDGTGFGEALAYLRKPGAFMTDAIQLASPLLASFRGSQSVADTLRVIDVIVRGVAGAATDSLSIGEAAKAAYSIRVLEGLGLQRMLQSAAKASRSFADSVKLIDGLIRLVGADAVDSVALADALTRRYAARPRITETVGLASSSSGALVLRVSAEDTVALDDLQILKAIYLGQLSDNLEVAAAYISPNGNLTTWAINTMSGAVTEYERYGYNSFGKFGHKYLGASESGLYELNGETDNGQAIAASIKTGLMQMAGTHFTQFANAYLGLRGDGEFILRVEDGEGNSYDYTVTADPVASTKVTLGKGLKARYFSFELISDGADFDLDSIEFLPLMSKRRV